MFTQDLNQEVQLSTTAHGLKVQWIPNLEPALLDLGINYDEAWMEEQLARNYAIFREESIIKIRQGSVVIVDCGGVGIWTAVI
ncbi:hypothetical protein BYT27DRAFT_6448613 [Phlegmacium glaucopus]|nr:hypothetical protein BYT27DRAFT_6448613 [Phlegmacium glaucopus]